MRERERESGRKRKRKRGRERERQRDRERESEYDKCISPCTSPSRRTASVNPPPARHNPLSSLAAAPPSPPMVLSCLTATGVPRRKAWRKRRRRVSERVRVGRE